MLTEDNIKVVLFGSGSDVILADEILNAIKSDLINNLVGKLNIRQTAAVISKCKLFIGNDSGLLHVAASVGAPTISIFGPTAPWDKVPIGENHCYFYSNETCSPCFKYGKFPDCKDQKCFERINYIDIFNKIKAMLQR